MLWLILQLVQAERLANVGLGLAKDSRGTRLYTALKIFAEKIRNLKLAEGQGKNPASHREKRSFVSFNGIYTRPAAD